MPDVHYIIAFTNYEQLVFLNMNAETKINYLHDIATHINSMCERLHLSKVEFLHIDVAGNGEFGGEMVWMGTRYPVLFKANCSALTIDRIVKRSEERGKIFFCTPYITPSLADLMVKHDCPYADSAGNLFFRNGDTVVLVQNQKKPQSIERKYTRGRAWTLTGLKVLFLLLTEDGALNWPYRKIAEYSDVSLGSVRYVMADLKNAGVIAEVNGQNRWNNKSTATADWSIAYKDKLLPALDRRFYAGDIPKEWGRFRLAVSGETAVQELTLLKSRRFLAYKHGNINLCIAQNRWRESAEGNIEIRQAFWPECRIFAEYVPWLLVYADLLAEDDPRCNEAALEVYHRYMEERS